MPELKDGESVEIQGSARNPYVLKNVGGVYSCTCPAWRNQSLPIERRTCKHLRRYRGEQAEQDRIGGPLPTRRAGSADRKPHAPQLLLAHRWDNDIDLAGWWMSEKLDGVRAYWDGQRFLSRQGNLFHAPAWFIAGLPEGPLDGELWLARKSFQRTVSIVRRQDESELWQEIVFVMFDAPEVDGDFEARQAFLQATFDEHQPSYARVLQQDRCTGLSHLREELARIEALGGEGLMLRQPASSYETGRSSTLLKVKTFHDAEARVVEHLAGRGRHKGRLGALAAELPDGTSFSVGTGLSDAQRESPPPVGSVITFRYQELSDGGVPRFPSFVRVFRDAEEAEVPQAARSTTRKSPSSRGSAKQPTDPDSTGENSDISARYFEFVDGKSQKFWEITVSGSDVTVRYGRIGSDGQSKTKSLCDEATAARHAEKLIAAKTGKGYAETIAS
jgi:DNA ligase-1